MPNPPTPLRALIETRLRRPLATYVPHLQRAGLGWRAIAENVSRDAGVTVSHETLRGWFAKKDAA